MPAKNIVKVYHENSFYHIYNRGINKSSIFLDDQDYKTFLFYLKIYLSPLESINLQGETLKVAPSRQLKNFHDQVQLLSYCLMPNHFHLLIHQHDASAINFFMRSLATKYSMFFNRRYHRVGTIFQGAYKAVMVESEEQLIYLSKYIHRNPLGPTRRSLEGYKYSSYPNYLGLFHQSWVNTEDVLSYFGSKKTNNSYQDFVEETEDKDIATIKSLTLDADE